MGNTLSNSKNLFKRSFPKIAELSKKPVRGPADLKNRFKEMISPGSVSKNTTTDNFVKVRKGKSNYSDKMKKKAGTVKTDEIKGN